MATWATKLNSNYYRLTDAAVDGTSVQVNNNFVKQAYTWLKGEGYVHVTGRVSNQGADFLIAAYAEVDLNNLRAEVVLRHSVVETSNGI